MKNSISLPIVLSLTINLIVSSYCIPFSSWATAGEIAQSPAPQPSFWGQIRGSDNQWHLGAVYADGLGPSIGQFLTMVVRANDVWRIDMSAPSFDRADLAQVARIRELRELKITSGFVSDGTLEPLRGLQKLETLELDCPGVDGELFADPGFPALRTLRILHRDGIAKRYLDILRKEHPGLNVIQIQEPAADNLQPELSEKQSKSETDLRLQGIFVGFRRHDDGTWFSVVAIHRWPKNNTVDLVKLIEVLPTCEEILLDDPDVSDDNIEKLLQLKSLRVVSISGHLITDAGMKALGKLPQLNELKIDCPKVTIQPFVTDAFSKLTLMQLTNYGSFDSESLAKLQSQRRLQITIRKRLGIRDPLHP